jgi:hypothetical protein
MLYFYFCIVYMANPHAALVSKFKLIVQALELPNETEPENIDLVLDEIKLLKSTTVNQIWTLVCSLCSEKITQLTNQTIVSHEAYNSACIMANNVYAAYSANFHRMHLAENLLRYVDVQGQISSLQGTVVELSALKGEMQVLFNSSSHANVIDRLG